MTFLDKLKDKEETATFELVQDKSPEDGLASLEDAILSECVGVVSAATRFAEVTPSDVEPPEEWVSQLGEKEAAKAFRVAQQAWLPKKDSAMGIELAAKMTMGIIAARAKRGSGGSGNKLQVSLVGMTAPAVSYKRIQDKEE